MQIVNAPEQDREQIINLLRENQLPAEDLPSSLNRFYAAIDANQVVGVIGMEDYGSYGLLRSMAVHPRYRNQYIAQTLVKELEQEAQRSGITDMYLLTETADNYFRKLGYHTITRSEVPAEVRASSEFSHVCPVSAIVMTKRLGTYE